MFLDLGMHRGPLLAYLMADPELSLQSILMVAAVIGRTKTFTYVGLVALFSIVAGLTYGAWVDGTSRLAIVVGLALLLGALALLLLALRRWLVHRSRSGTARTRLIKERHHEDRQDPRARMCQLQEAGSGGTRGRHHRRHRGRISSRSPT